ncbi:hypothetical protein QGN29_08405 [Temperatibacter marinus]|uniref:Uncharacterized protein n=1 Tax=Temperatibacter marinus TaxID=1456591 RepID=A0AA52H9D8_9PROT|nr:hypothetical protein [Temperatibacter marinus]WND01580.1 hypothetical protein QGN29_08405 [Temperatibacter marinus]
MARPLPKDVESQIKGAAQRSESLSFLIVGLILGSAFGFGLAAAIFSDDHQEISFLLGFGVVGILWWMSTRATRKSQEEQIEK